MFIRELLEEIKNDEYIYGPNNLRLTLTHIIKEFNLPTTGYWVFQHWQALPKPALYTKDIREFGYFILNGDNLSYKTIPAELTDISTNVKIIPLQYRGLFVPSRIPTAGNYFPNTEMVFINDKFTIRRKQ